MASSRLKQGVPCINLEIFASAPLRAAAPVMTALFLLLPRPILAAAKPHKPAFVLATARTYAPGENAKFVLRFRDVSAIKFRVYRVAHPVRFFEQLKNPHQIGGPKVQIPEVPTLLELWSRWKRELRYSMKNFLRHQFSYAFRAAYVRRHSRHYTSLKVAVTHFAEVPVLNHSQLVVRWTELLPRERDWDSRVIPLRISGSGLYLVEASAHGRFADTILIITHLGLVMKSAPGQIVIFAAGRKRGQPRPGTRIVLRPAQRYLAKMTMQGVTGADGSVSFNLPGGAPQDWVALGQKGDDFAATDLPSWFFNSASTKTILGYLYTDRPVYRPGETVQYRGILREQQHNLYHIPAVRQIQVKITDGSGKTVAVQTLPLTAMGAFAGSLKLAASSELGYYSMTANPVGITGDESVNASAYFSVQDYKLPAYHVDVKPEQPRILEGGTESINISARYYYGDPVPAAKLTWKLLRSSYWSPWEYEWSDDIDEGDYGGYDYGGTPIQQGQGRLDAQGRFRLQIPVPVASRQGNYSYRLVVGVTDLANREIDGAGTFIATYSDDQVAIAAVNYFAAAGAAVPFNVRAATYENKPIAVALTASDALYSWLAPKGSRAKPLASVNFATSADGTAQFALTCNVPGDHRVTVAGFDAHGRRFSDETYFYCQGPSALPYATESGQVTLKTDKKSYQPGDIARVLVQLPAWKHPSPVWLWLTTELDRVRTHAILKADGNTATFAVPITADDMPDIMADVTFLRNGQMYTGEVRINVPANRQALRIQIEPGKPQYTPGDEASVTVSVRDAAGHPVANADLGIAVIDDAIYAIAPDSSPDIFQYFYGYRVNQVSVQYSADYYFEGWSGHHRLKLARRPVTSYAELAGALGDVKPTPAPPTQPHVRKKFTPTAFWRAGVRTGADGRATVHFKLPDSLTSWRIGIRAVTASTQVGSALAHFVTRKNLMLDLALPRFAVEGDQWTTYAIVHNDLPTTQQVHLTLAAKTGAQAGGVQVANSGTPKLAVASHQQQRYPWQLTATRAGNVNLLGAAIGQTDSDALELPLPIKPNGIELAQSYSGELSTTDQASFSWQPPAGARPAGSYLLLHLAPSLTATALGALQNMIQYPYGCTEQTSSVMLSILAVRAAARSLHHPELAPDAQLLPRLRTGIARLAHSQNNDGGWGWWPATPSDPYMSALAVEALAGAQAAGAAVNASLLQRGHDYLVGLLRDHPRMIPDLQAPLLLAARRSGTIAPALTDNLWSWRSKLSLQGRAEMVLLLAETKDARAPQALQRLLGMAKSNALEMWLPQAGDAWLGFGDLDDSDWSDWYIDFDIDDSSLTTATALEAMLRLEPSDPRVVKAIRYLVGRSANDWWVSTEQTAEVITALADSLQRSGAGAEMNPNFTARVKVNGATVDRHRFTAADLQAQARELRIPLGPGPVTVSLNRQGPGVLYWDATVVSYSRDDRYVHRGGFKLNILRQYFRLQAVKTVDSSGQPAIGYRPVPLAGALHVGDVLLVKLTVSGGRQAHLLIDDPIPAGVEPVPLDSLYPLLNKDGKVGYEFDSNDFYDWFGYSRVFRDDRVSFFQDRFQPGQHTYSYLVRVIIPGKFTALPPRVEPMYDASRLATGDRNSMQFLPSQP